MPFNVVISFEKLRPAVITQDICSVNTKIKIEYVTLGNLKSGAILKMDYIIVIKAQLKQIINPHAAGDLYGNCAKRFLQRSTVEL